MDDPSRRGFVKGAAAVGAFIALDAIGGLGLAVGTTPRTKAATNAEAVIFPDPTLCIGCLTCEVICSRVHREQGLSAVPRIRIFNDPAVKVNAEVQRAYPDRGTFHQEVCLQCPTAECLYVCPVDAFQVEPRTGARIIQEKSCVSCGRCSEACPFPVSDLTEAAATNQIRLGQQTRITYDPAIDAFTKCDLCHWRPEGPACVERCPINVRIKQGVLKSDHLCLEAPKSDVPTWDRLRADQTFGDSPAKGKA
ncbi:MAG: 4Fe-4S dicluster domain-containing protein [Chloroflexota bacterium]